MNRAASRKGNYKDRRALKKGKLPKNGNPVFDYNAVVDKQQKKTGRRSP